MGLTQARIAVDAMGGDYAPAEIVAGAIRAREELGVEILLVGDPEKIKACVADSDSLSRIEIVPAEGTIEMHEEPLSALRKKRKASINVAMDMVKKGRADA
ncbi:MAG: phosphate acyltransferase, partial [Cyanobacteria bacterium J06627_3]